MRLKPDVLQEEVLDWLEARAVELWGVEPGAELREALLPVAQAMAEVSAADVPDEAEPLLL
jgi:hypothetical protein